MLDFLARPHRVLPFLLQSYCPEDTKSKKKALRGKAICSGSVMRKSFQLRHLATCLCGLLVVRKEHHLFAEG